MLISYQKRFLFIHVPKTGGTSMRAVLRRHAHSPRQQPINRWLEMIGVNVNHVLGNYRDYRFRTHERASVVAKRIPSDVFDELFKFGFVRNPWDLIPSLYRFIRENKKHKRHRIVAKMNFAEFVEFAVSKQIARQKRLIAGDDGTILLDFVGRFERLNEDYQHIAERLGISIPLPHLNRTQKPMNRVEYYDPGTIEAVRHGFREDLEAFGYPDSPDVSLSNSVVIDSAA